MSVERYYFFTSEHRPKGSYNEIHPCRIVRTRWYERGWYLNSFYRISRFKGIKIGRISMGMVGGYRKYRIPYIAYHWDGGFTLPVSILKIFDRRIKIDKITCTYGDRTLKTSLKMVWNKWVR